MDCPRFTVGSYQAQKFAQARSCLMLPHPMGEAQSIADAFHMCLLGLDDLDRDRLDEDAADKVRQLEVLMETTGLEDPGGVGLFRVKAERFTNEEKSEVSELVDELASWFDDPDLRSGS
jgi:hypothetical protein